MSRVLSEAMVREVVDRVGLASVDQLAASHEALRAALDTERADRRLEAEMFRTDIATCIRERDELRAKLAEVEEMRVRLQQLDDESPELLHNVLLITNINSVLRTRVAELEGAARYARSVLADVVEGEVLPVTPEIAMNRLDAALAAAPSGKEFSDGLR